MKWLQLNPWCQVSTDNTHTVSKVCVGIQADDPQALAWRYEAYRTRQSAKGRFLGGYSDAVSAKKACTADRERMD
jgi:hypothetical protein